MHNGKPNIELIGDGTATAQQLSLGVARQRPRRREHDADDAANQQRRSRDGNTANWPNWRDARVGAATATAASIGWTRAVVG